MNETNSSIPLDPGVERLLTSLIGVFSAHVVTGPEGTLREIHILATHELHPKQVVRNVESALSAGLGIEIDRRIVSVAQVRPEAVSARAAPSTHPAPGDTAPPNEVNAPLPEPPAERPERDDGPWRGLPRRDVARADLPGRVHATGRTEHPRVVFIGYDARLDADRRATCRVTLRAGADEFTGAGLGPDTPRGRAEAAAQATFAALLACGSSDGVGLEGVAIVEARARRYVLIAARALRGRRPIILTGAAPVDRSPEEAAILASLQATNRWRASF